MRPRSAPFSLDHDTVRRPPPAGKNLNSDCRIWKWGFLPQGYGRVKVKGKTMTTARLFFELFKGPLPKGHVPDHLCEVKACCEPEHLEAVTHAVNSSREWKSKGYKRWAKQPKA